MNQARALKLRKRFMRWAFAVLVTATLAKVAGFDALFMPLAAVCTVLLARASHWDGWATGNAAKPCDHPPALLPSDR